MDKNPTPRSKALGSRPRSDRTNIEHLTELGAGTREHRFLRHAANFALPTVVAITLQTAVYLAFYTRTAPHWPSAFTAVAVLALVPLVSAATLSIFRRQEAPIIAAAATIFVYFSFAITLLSALRVAISFAGLAAALPFTLLIMAIANVRFRKRLSTRTALIAFEGISAVNSLLRTSSIAIIKDPLADISAFDTVLIDPREHHTKQWSNLLARCYVAGVEIMPWTQFVEVRHGRVHIASFDVSHLSYTPSQFLYARAKRFLDLAAVLLTLPATFLLASLTALYIFARDGGPVIFVQHRVGIGGIPFRVYKFRTMRRGTGGGATNSSDKRIIPGCHFIRRTRLDELPQLYNILRGDMSLIGPRPEAVDLVKWYKREIPEWHYRTLILPGITGWAQVNSGYTSNPEEARIKLEYDLYYIKHLSFDLDLQILFRTIRTIILGDGAR